MRRVLLLFSMWALAFTFSTAASDAAEPQYLDIQVHSGALTAFWGRPIDIDAHVLLPDSFYKEPQRHYPVIYWISGFDGDGRISMDMELDWQAPMRALREQFIIVSLEGMFEGGHDEFADSANNGPWGTAFTQEFVPAVEAQYRAFATPQTRFVAGHSSGGWSALWLQVTYPDLFGGEWSLSPDPVDFRDFTGPDITKVPAQNFFTDASGHDYKLDGQLLRTFVVGPGWEKRQYESFDAVFSPRDADGKPEPLFDRRTGVIDPAVASYWEMHYDIARLLRDHWSTLGPKLQGKLHIIVGSADQFDLEAPVEMLADELRGLGSDAQFNVIQGDNHFTIYGWRGSALSEIVREATASIASKPTSGAAP